MTEKEPPWLRLKQPTPFYGSKENSLLLGANNILTLEEAEKQRIAGRIEVPGQGFKYIALLSQRISTTGQDENLSLVKTEEYAKMEITINMLVPEPECEKCLEPTSVVTYSLPVNGLRDPVVPCSYCGHQNLAEVIPMTRLDEVAVFPPTPEIVDCVDNIDRNRRSALAGFLRQWPGIDRKLDLLLKSSDYEEPNLVMYDISDLKEEQIKGLYVQAGSFSPIVGQVEERPDAEKDKVEKLANLNLNLPKGYENVFYFINDTHCLAKVITNYGESIVFMVQFEKNRPQKLIVNSVDLTDKSWNMTGSSRNRRTVGLLDVVDWHGLLVSQQGEKLAEELTSTPFGLIQVDRRADDPREGWDWEKAWLKTNFRLNFNELFLICDMPDQIEIYHTMPQIEDSWNLFDENGRYDTYFWDN